jgi:hypothetical protein
MTLKISGRKALGTYIRNDKYGWHFGHAVDSVSNRNVNQEYFLGGNGSRCVELTTLPPSGAECIKISEPQPPGTLRVSPGIALHYMAGRLRDWIVNNMVRETKC